MKFNKTNSIIPILLLAFFNAFGNNTISVPADYNNLNSREFDYLRAHQNTTAVFLKEISVISLFRVNPENIPGNSGSDLGKKYSSFIINNVPDSLNSWNYLPDLRNILNHYIFPFHFFW